MKRQTTRPQRRWAKANRNPRAIAGVVRLCVSGPEVEGRPTAILPNSASAWPPYPSDISTLAAVLTVYEGRTGNLTFPHGIDASPAGCERTFGLRHGY